MSTLQKRCIAALVLACCAWGFAEDDPPDRSASPQREVQWYLDTLRHGVDPIDNDDERHRALNRIHGRMGEQPSVYFPLLLKELEETRDPQVENYALRTMADPSLLPKFGKERVQGILRGYVTGERDPLPTGEEWSALSTAVSMYRHTADPSDAQDLLKLVSDENPYLASAATETIAKIADPSIIPALEEAVRRRIEEYPEDYQKSVEDKLPIYLKKLADHIRERYPDWNVAHSQAPTPNGELNPPEAEETRAEEGGAQKASELESEADSVERRGADEGSRGGWGHWALGGLAVLAAAAYALAEARRKG